MDHRAREEATTGTPLIPDDFPFTAEEVRAAVRRWLPDGDPDETAEAIIESARYHRERRAERSEAMRRAGHEPPEGWDGFEVHDALLAHLAMLSESAAERVCALMERRWTVLRSAAIEHERQRAAERAGLRPTIEDLLDDAERRGEFSWDDPAVFRGIAVFGPAPPPLPEPTPEVIAVAEARVAGEKRRWEALLNAVRRGEQPPPEPEPNVIMDIDAAAAEETLPGPAPDWAFMDDSLRRWDRKGRGERELLGALARDLPRFNAELVRALHVDARRAVARAIMFPLLRGAVSGAIPVDAPVGVALRGALGESALPQNVRSTGELYVAADLLEWWEANRGGYGQLPLFDEWRGRARTRREVRFMRLVRGRFDDLFPYEPSAG